MMSTYLYIMHVLIFFNLNFVMRFDHFEGEAPSKEKLL